MNKLIEKMSEITYTENGDMAYNTTGNKVLDLFARGGAMRFSQDEDIIYLFQQALMDDPTYALRCLFYLRAPREGQGERRFFRVCYKWLAQNYPEAAKSVMQYVPILARWDDLFILFDTSLEHEMTDFIKEQLTIDLDSEHPSLAAKWQPSENSSSFETKKLAKRFRKAWRLSSKEYRQILSHIRAKINLVESQMSANEWDEIDFATIPSVAGFRYRKCFFRRDETSERYTEFMENKDTKVKASVLYPYQVVHEALNYIHYEWSNRNCHSELVFNGSPAEREAINKYWDNLTDYFKGASLNALCVIDTSGSMEGLPIEVATSLGLYCADKAKGPFQNHYISFSSKPQLVKIEGKDFWEKVVNIQQANLCENTDIEKTFMYILGVAKKYHLTQEDMPEQIIVISDMQVDLMTINYMSETALCSVMEKMREVWEQAGYQMPKLVYWNVNAQKPTFPEQMSENVSFVSGCSPILFKGILTGKTGIEMMKEMLNAPAFEGIEVKRLG